MKLEVGMYCYDKCNRKIGIGKIDEFRKNNNVVVQYKNFLGVVSSGNIIASDDITDLIEVGDIVYIEEADDYACYFFRDIYMIRNEDNLLRIIDLINKPNVRLLSILTKEQFENNCFKIGE